MSPSYDSVSHGPINKQTVRVWINGKKKTTTTTTTSGAPCDLYEHHQQFTDIRQKGSIIMSIITLQILACTWDLIHFRLG